MGEGDISISKTTAMLAIALVVVVGIGAYVLFAQTNTNDALPCASASAGAPCPATGGQQAQGSAGQLANAAANGNNGNSPSANQPNQAQATIQDVYIKATSYGYDKYEVTVKKGIPVRLHFTAINAGCGSYLKIYGMNVGVQSKGGQEATVEFTPTSEGTYEYNCGMRMFPPGKFVVVA